MGVVDRVDRIALASAIGVGIAVPLAVLDFPTRWWWVFWTAMTGLFVAGAALSATLGVGGIRAAVGTENASTGRDDGGGSVRPASVAFTVLLSVLSVTAVALVALAGVAALPGTPSAPGRRLVGGGAAVGALATLLSGLRVGGPATSRGGAGTDIAGEASPADGRVDEENGPTGEGVATDRTEQSGRTDEWEWVGDVAEQRTRDTATSATGVGDRRTQPTENRSDDEDR